MAPLEPVEAARRPRVLLIEDKLTERDLYAMILEHEFEVLAATRGEEGYRLACDIRPNAIIVDVLLPDGDGLELCVRLLTTLATATIPLIVLTGDEAAYVRALTLRALAAVYRKPCPGEDLLRAVRHAVSVRRVGQRAR